MFKTDLVKQFWEEVKQQYETGGLKQLGMPFPDFYQRTIQMSETKVFSFRKSSIDYMNKTKDPFLMMMALPECIRIMELNEESLLVPTGRLPFYFDPNPYTDEELIERVKKLLVFT